MNVITTVTTVDATNNILSRQINLDLALANLSFLYGKVEASSIAASLGAKGEDFLPPFEGIPSSESGDGLGFTLLFFWEASLANNELWTSRFSLLSFLGEGVSSSNSLIPMSRLGLERALAVFGKSQSHSSLFSSSSHESWNDYNFETGPGSISSC